MRHLAKVSVSEWASSSGSAFRCHCMQMHVSQAGSQDSLVCSLVARVICPLSSLLMGSECA